MRLIDLDRLPLESYGEDVISWYATGWNDAINAINRAPTVDAEPVRHGEWIGKCVNAGKHFVMTVVVPVCSECGSQAVNQEFTNYCPNCGAKMDGGKHETENKE